MIKIFEIVGTEYSDVVRYMLEHDCKLEQEAMDL